MPRRPVLASVTALSVALGTALLSTPAGAAPPDPKPHGLDPSLSGYTLADARKLVGISGAEGTVTAFVQLTTPAGVDVQDDGKAAVKAAAAETKAAAKDVVPAELTEKNAQTAAPKRLGTVTNLAAGALVTGDAAQVAKLAKDDSVKAIYRVATKRPTNSATVTLTRALATWQNTGVTGEGVSIAVIDTGLDYTHADFGGPGTIEAYDEAYGEDGTQPVPAGLFDAAKFVGGYDFAGPLYDASLDEPGSTDVPSPDDNPIDSLSTSANSGHGTHVAGTAAGYGVTADGDTFAGDYGALSDVADFQIGPGSAPGAKLYAFKVFGDIGGSTDLTALALDRAADPNADGDFSDHVDVVNMSLGSDGSPADDPDNLLVDQLTALGVVVAVASGNAGDLTDIGGAPGNATSALTVANSVGQPVLDAAEVTGASDASLVGAKLAGQNSVAYTGADVTAPVAYVGATFDGCTAFTAAEAAVVADKIAYLYWDEGPTRRCGSAARFNNATAAGAVGVLLDTSVPSFSAGIAGNDQVPGFQMTLGTTNALMGEVAAGTLALHIGPGLAQSSSQVGTEDTLNAGSSRGVHGSLGWAKTDVAAPGTGIMSAASGGGAQGHVLSGTSMATPNVAGIAALVRSAHTGWTADEVKAAIVNTATHDVTTQGGGAGLVYGPQRTGAGRVDALQAVSTNVIAFNTQTPAQTSVSFGVVNVGASTVTAKKTVTVRNFGSTSQRFTTSVTKATTAGGATITASPASITVPAGGRPVVVTLTLTADPATLKHQIDPTSDVLQSGVPREFVAEVAGRLVLKSASQELRVPVQAAPRLVSDLKASNVAFTGATGSLAFSGRGIDTGGWQSIATPLILAATSPKLEDNPGLVASQSALRSGDLRYVGWSSTAPYITALGGDPDVYGLLNVGLATDGDWASLGTAVIPVIDIDTDGDGEPDFESIVTKLNADSDITTVLTFDLSQPASAPPVDLQLVNNEFGDLDSGVFDRNVLVAPIAIGALGLAPGAKPTLSVWTYSGYAENDVLDEVAPFQVDPYTPPFWFENTRDGFVTSDADAGGSVVVHRAAGVESGKLLVLHHNNATPGSRAQVVGITAPKPSTTSLKVTGGATFGVKATLTATVSPAAAAGTVVFKDGAATIATATVKSGKATASAPLAGAGTRSVTAVFTPATPSAFTGSTSAPVSVSVAKATTASLLLTVPPIVKQGKSATAVVQVLGVTAPPSGTVTVKSKGVVLGTGTLAVKGNLGTAKIALPAGLAPGLHILEAVYGGSATTKGSSAPMILVVLR